MRISIVVPTRGRAQLLDRCLGALARQDLAEPYEIVVVDDGGEADDPVTVPVIDGTDVRLVPSLGRGPAAARNVGVQAARGEIVLFTDDDTVPACSWARNAVAHLDAHPDHVGVEGPTTTDPFDHLYEHSVESRGGHAFFTCNIAYRRRALERLDGFFEGFPYPHCEDRDLGYRALELGEVGTCQGMVVAHPPRPARIRELVRRGRLVASEMQLMARHPDRYLDGGRAHPAVVAIRGLGMRWVRLAMRERRSLLRSPRRTTRFAIVAVGQLAVATVTAVSAVLRRR